MDKVIHPVWAAPANVHAFFTTRQEGYSAGAYRSFNLAAHVDDKPEAVRRNRGLLSKILPGDPFWLEQVHSNHCIDLDSDGQERNRADACFTGKAKQVLAVMVADCLPILLTTRLGDHVGVIHAGWRGLASGVIREFLNSAQLDWIAWMGPAIGPCHYEVGSDVRDLFAEKSAFVESDLGWKMNLYQIARIQLNACGILDVTGGDCCTYCDTERFYSYRRDGKTGRMAGFIWCT